ncbi:MAG: DUF4214 domain-containing protein [Clostridiales bacterium]|nr:DUF4214 domain-containing protein [Clostridiales bacterium]
MKHLRTKALGIALAFSFLCGSSPVLASPPSAVAMDHIYEAEAFPYGGTGVHVEVGNDVPGRWYSFTPATSATYYMYSFNCQDDTEIYLYDSDAQYLTQIDDGGIGHNFGLKRDLEAGKTYYTYVTRHGSNTTEIISFDYNITWFGDIERTITFDGETSETYEIQVDAQTEHTITMNVTPPGDVSDYTYQWTRYNHFTDSYDVIPGATSASYTIGEGADQYRAFVMLDGSARSADFVIERYHQNVSYEDMVVHSLGDAGAETVAAIPGVTGTDSTVRNLSCPLYWLFYADPAPEGPYDPEMPWSTEDWVEVPGFDHTVIDLLVGEEDYYLPAGSNIFDFNCVFVAFVKSDENTCEINPDEPLYVQLHKVQRGEDEYNGMIGMGNATTILDCKVCSFTPEASGTYTVTSSAIEGGDPYVAIFDSDYRSLSYMDNSNGYNSLEHLWDEQDDTGTDLNFSLSQHLNGGETYYFVLWAYDRHASSEITGAAYTATLTCDELDTFNVGLSVNGSGTATASPAEGNYGTEVTLTATPGSGYRFVSWEVISGGVTVTDNRFTLGNSDVQIRANFEAIPTEAPATPAPSTPTPTIPQDNNGSSSEGGVAGFVERLYTIALGRASDPVGKRDWIDAITLRGETGAGCARGFLYSPEFLNKGVSNEEFVATLYRTFFDREPDQAGFNAWVEVLNNGTSKEEVIEGFINSTEWANLCLFYGIRNGGTGVPNIEIEPNQATIDFATRLYTTCLGRSADQAGLMAWARQLANQRDTGTGAARGFFFSSEFTGQNVSNGEYVTRLYRTFMNREPEQAGFDAWVSQLDSGVSRGEVFNGFAQSIEFARICALYGIVR